MVTGKAVVKIKELISFQDPRKDCEPVDCVDKYNGWRNFFRNATGKCEVVHECYTKGKKGELPEIVCSPECVSLIRSPYLGCHATLSNRETVW